MHYFKHIMLCCVTKSERKQHLACVTHLLQIQQTLKNSSFQAAIKNTSIQKKLRHSTPLAPPKGPNSFILTCKIFRKVAASGVGGETQYV